MTAAILSLVLVADSALLLSVVAPRHGWPLIASAGVFVVALVALLLLAWRYERRAYAELDRRRFELDRQVDWRQRELERRREW